jgi:hypothetical protein
VLHSQFEHDPTSNRAGALKWKQIAPQLLEFVWAQLQPVLNLIRYGRGNRAGTHNPTEGKGAGLTG